MRVRADAGAVVVVASVLACHRPGPNWPLAPVGANALDEKQSIYADDGAGWLARASVHAWIGDDDNADDASNVNTRIIVAAAGGDEYGNPFAGDPYGGHNYAGWQPQAWDSSRVDAFSPSYETVDGLTGAIEGTLTWTGATPTRVTSGCGVIDPSVRIGARAAVRGAIVYIEKIDSGRQIPTAGRPMVVGGTIAKHGCGFEPVAQIVAPSPAPVAIYGDDRATTLRVTQQDGVMTTVPLQAGAIADVMAQVGTMQIADESGRTGAAWVIGLETPYYAITDDLGHFRIDQLPEGPFVVTIWQAPMPRLGANGVVTYGEPIVVHRNVKVVSAKISPLNVALGPR